jgi:hypothetical protein
VGPLSPNINYITFSETSWVLYGRGEGVVEFRDKAISLWEAAMDCWLVLAMGEIQFGLAYVVYQSGIIDEEPGFILLIGLFIALGCLCVFFVLLRWWTLSFVRISGGKMSIHQPFRRHQPLREFKVMDITSVQTSLDSTTFHSLFSMGVWLRDGTKVTFLRCRDTPEAKWVLKLMKEAILNEALRVAAAIPEVSDANQAVI